MAAWWLRIGSGRGLGMGVVMTPATGAITDTLPRANGSARLSTTCPESWELLSGSPCPISRQSALHDIAKDDLDLTYKILVSELAYLDLAYLHVMESPGQRSLALEAAGVQIARGDMLDNAYLRQPHQPRPQARSLWGYTSTTSLATSSCRRCSIGIFSILNQVGGAIEVRIRRRQEPCEQVQARH